MAAPTVVRSLKVLVAVVAVGLMVMGVIAILVGLLGRVSTGTGGPVPEETAPAATSAAGDPVKVVSVPDGDTIVVAVADGTERVRVIGIDTPEIGSKDCFAVEAAQEARALVQGKNVVLRADPTQDDRDRYGRLLRHVTMSDGRSMAEVLIAGGFGREYTYDKAYAGQAAHRAAQTAAQKAGLGVWGGGCAEPARPTASAAPLTGALPSPSGTCVIKGNIASDGEQIFHVPGQRHYDVTRIDESKGERWFCSVAEAQSAGFRPSRE